MRKLSRNCQKQEPAYGEASESVKRLNIALRFVDDYVAIFIS